MRKSLFSLLIILLTACNAGADSADPQLLFASTLDNPLTQAVPLKRYQGKPLVVNFWARWCPPCRAEIPELNDFQRRYQGRIQVLGIGLEDNPALVSDFVREYAMIYPVLLARQQAIPLMKSLGNTQGGLPYTVFIDAKGRIVGHKLGLLRPADLEAAARQLLAD
ncbi:MAG: TlpA disulfide reductase family protein [Dechloromonas sp.]|nr:TlpA disulfide reductase family protein [Dechloromonas sp.]